MAEETPTDLSSHIYLDVIHVPSRPASKKSLCSANNQPLRKKPAVEKVTSPEKRQKSISIGSCILMGTIIFLSAACCSLGALYVIEKRHNLMLSSQENARNKASVPATNCTSNVKPDKSLDCDVMKSELTQRNMVYQTMCSNPLAEVESGPKPSQNKTKDCSTQSIKFQSTTQTVTSQGAKAMASATVCFWCKSSPGVVNYVVYIEPNNGPGFTILEEKPSGRTSDTSWHSFCWTWTTGEEQFRFYKDGQRLRGGEISRERRMTAGGTWVLGLISDTPGDLSRRTEVKRPGEITAVNVWNRVLRRKELAEMMSTCESQYKGNVKSWQDFTTNVKGDVKLVKSTCCNK